MKKISDEQKKNHPEVVEMAEDLGKVTALTAVADSEGGKILTQSLITDIVSNVDTLCAKYSSLNLQQFVAICADMKSKLDLVRVIKRSKKNKDDLESLISETLQQ